MFHKKVHPENSSAAKKSDKQRKKGSKNKAVASDTCSNRGSQLHGDGDIVMYPHGDHLPKEQEQYFRSQQKPSWLNAAECELNGNRECWIKTDADCKYISLPSR